MESESTFEPTPKIKKSTSPVSRPTAKRKITNAYRKIKGSFVVKLFNFVVVFAVLLFVGYFIVNLNVFYIQHVEVEQLTGDPFVNVSEDELESQLVEYIGQRIFLVQPGDIEQRMISANPFLKEVYAGKRLPNTINVKITERQPAIVVNITTSIALDEHLVTGFVADSEGYILASCIDEPLMCTNLPFINVVSRTLVLSPGSQPYIYGFPQVLQVLANVNEAGLKPSKFFMPEESVIVVEFSDATRAIFTAEKGIDQQLSDFHLTRSGLSQQGRTYLEVDLRYDRVVIRVDKYAEWVPQ